MLSCGSQLTNHQLIDALEVLEGCEVDDHLPPFGTHVHFDSGVEMAREQFFQLEQARRREAPGRRGGRNDIVGRTRFGLARSILVFDQG